MNTMLPRDMTQCQDWLENHVLTVRQLYHSTARQYESMHMFAPN